MKKGGIRHFFLNPYTSSILVGIILLFFASLYASLTSNIDLGKAFIVVALFRIPIPVWAIAFLLVVCLLVSRIVANHRRPPAYLGYVRDEIAGRTFRWQWAPTRDGRITPTKLEPICPDCECSLLRLPDQYNGPPKTWCPDCENPFDFIPESKMIEIQGIIVGKARTRFWKISEKFTNDTSSLPVDDSF